MRAVSKYPINFGKTSIMLPKYCKIVHFGIQRGIPCIWASVAEPIEPKQERTFFIFGTGQPIPEDFRLDHVQTAFEGDGTYVWHLYELVKPRSLPRG